MVEAQKKVDLYVPIEDIRKSPSEANVMTKDDTGKFIPVTIVGGGGGSDANKQTVSYDTPEIKEQLPTNNIEEQKRVQQKQEEIQRAIQEGRFVKRYENVTYFGEKGSGKFYGKTDSGAVFEFERPKNFPSGRITKGNEPVLVGEILPVKKEGKSFDDKNRDIFFINQDKNEKAESVFNSIEKPIKRESELQPSTIGSKITTFGGNVYQNIFGKPFIANQAPFEILAAPATAAVNYGKLTGEATEFLAKKVNINIPTNTFTTEVPQKATIGGIFPSISEGGNITSKEIGKGAAIVTTTAGLAVQPTNILAISSLAKGSSTLLEPTPLTSGKAVEAVAWYAGGILSAAKFVKTPKIEIGKPVTPKIKTSTIVDSNQAKKIGEITLVPAQVKRTITYPARVGTYTTPLRKTFGLKPKPIEITPKTTIIENVNALAVPEKNIAIGVGSVRKVGTKYATISERVGVYKEIPTKLFEELGAGVGFSSNLFRYSPFSKVKVIQPIKSNAGAFPSINFGKTVIKTDTYKLVKELSFFKNYRGTKGLYEKGQRLEKTAQNLDDGVNLPEKPSKDIKISKQVEKQVQNLAENLKSNIKTPTPRNTIPKQIPNIIEASIVKPVNNKPSTSIMLNEKTSQIQKIDEKSTVSEAQPLKYSSKTSMIENLRIGERQIQPQQESLKTSQSEAQAQILRVEQAQALRTQQVRSSILRVKSPTNRIRTRIIRPRNFIPSLVIGKGKNLKKGYVPLSYEQGYKVITYKGGKPIEIARGLPKGLATKRLLGELKTTLRASGKIIPYGTTSLKDIPIKISSEYRPAKRDRERIVQKRRFRLGTRTEIGEIMTAKRRRRWI